MRKLLFVPLLSAVASVAAAEVNVELEGLASLSGSVYVSVYDSPDTWLGEDTLLTQEVDIEASMDGELVKVSLDLPPGDYALSIFFDANDNDELDTNWIGLPKEPVALSNNARPKFGPPKYKDAVFSLGEEPVLQRILIQAID